MHKISCVLNSNKIRILITWYVSLAQQYAIMDWLLDRVKVLRPTRHKICHFGDILNYEDTEAADVTSDTVKHTVPMPLE